MIDEAYGSERCRGVIPPNPGVNLPKKPVEVIVRGKEKAFAGVLGILLEDLPCDLHADGGLATALFPENDGGAGAGEFTDDFFEV